MVNRTAAGRYGVRLALAVALTAAIPCLGVQASASADPTGDATVADGGSHLVSTDEIDDRQLTMQVYSASMDRVIPLEVIPPADTSEPRPTLYLLNGAGGGEDSRHLAGQDRRGRLLRRQERQRRHAHGGRVQLLHRLGEARPGPGRQQVDDVPHQELPPIVDAALGTNGVNSIAGISMAGTSVLSLARRPRPVRERRRLQRLRETSTDPGRTYVSWSSRAAAAATPPTCGGRPTAPAGRPTTPSSTPRSCADIDMYVSNGPDCPAPRQPAERPGINGDVGTLANQMIVGGIIEAATNQCTHALADRLNELRIPQRSTSGPSARIRGGYWQDDLHNSWPMLAASIGL